MRGERSIFLIPFVQRRARKRKGLPSDLYNLVSRLLLHQTYILYWAALEIMSSSSSCPTPCILGKLDNFLIAKVKTNHSFQMLFDFILIQNVAHSYSFCFKSWIDRLKNEKHFLAGCLCQTRGGTQGISWHWVITVSSIDGLLKQRVHKRTHDQKVGGGNEPFVRCYWGDHLFLFV